MTIINKVSNKTLMPGITAIPDVPDAPTIGTATGTSGTSASVTFTAAATGGSVTTFTATSTPGSFTGTSATSPITISGLTTNTSYTFKIKGTNATATGPESAASNSVTLTTPVYAYFAGGSTGTATAVIDYVDFSSGGTASSWGNLTFARQGIGLSSTTRGLVFGGNY